MAGGENLGAKFTIDITDLKAGLNQANRLIRQSESEFQAAAAGMDDWSDSSEGLQKRVDSLSDQVEIQQEKVAALVKEKKRIVMQMNAEGKSNEEIEKAIDGVNKKITQESKQLNTLKGRLSNSQKALDGFNDAQEDAKRPSEKLADTLKEQGDRLDDLKKDYADAVISHGKYSKEAKSLQGQISKLTGEIEENEKALSDASDSAEDAGDSFAGLKTAAGVAVGAVAAVGAAAAAVVGSFLGLAESTRETRTNMAKLETAFETAGHTAETAADTYTTLYGILGDEGQATEAASHLAKLVTTEEELVDWTTIATGVYATFGDSLPIESLTEAANETAKTGTITGGLADALNWAGANEDEFQKKLDACTTEQERQALITSTLNGLYGEAAEAYRENNAAVIEAQEAQANYNAKLAELGEKAEPIMTAVTNGFASILEAIIGLLEGADFDAITAGIESAFAYFVDTVIPGIVNGFTWISDNWPLIEAGILAVGAAFAAFQVVSLIQSVTSALKGMSIAQAALNLVMSLNPIGLVVAAIAGLIAAFVALWNNCEGFREFWINLWEIIKNAASVAWEAIKGFFSAAWDWCVSIWNGAGEWFGGIWTAISDAFSGAAQWFSDTFNTAWQWIQDAWSGVTGWFGGIWTGISDAFSGASKWFGDTFSSAWTAITKAWSGVSTWFSDLWDDICGWFDASDFLTIGSDIVSGLWDGINDGAEWLKDKISGWADNIVGWAKGFLGIASPSKVFADEVGENMALGVGVGFTDGMKGVAKDVNDALGKAVPTVKVSASGGSGRLASGANGGVTVYQTNNYSQAHSRYELYKSKQDTAAAVRAALGGA